MPPPERLTLDRIPTPIGEMVSLTDETGALCVLDFGDTGPRLEGLIRRHYGEVPISESRAPETVRCALDRYYAGDIHALTGLAWRTGGTAFQRRVWETLTTIPPGATWTYAQLAAHIGSPRAVRAVGLANGANPVGVVVPCHRVIGSNGTLTGYGGGIERKRWLLRHEGAAFKDSPVASPRAVVLEQGLLKLA